jgi:hypothetical protein
MDSARDLQIKRGIRDDQPAAVFRTFLDLDSNKLSRKYLRDNQTFE